MNALEKFDIKKGDWIITSSSLCSTAFSLVNNVDFLHLKDRTTELIISYFNQWRFVVDAYEKLYNLFFALNNSNDQIIEDSIITEFDRMSLSYELEFKNYVYIFIAALKSFLDLFTCIIDTSQNHIIREEHKLPDFFNYGKKHYKENFIAEIFEQYEIWRDLSNKESWIVAVKLIRDKILHRGYLLKPQIGFHRIDNLLMQAYKGNMDGEENDIVDIGKMFESFLLQVPIMENKISEILIAKMPVLRNNQLYEVTFKYADLANLYEFNEIKYTIKLPIESER